jgi:nickel-dependent lactate racemase
MTMKAELLVGKDPMPITVPDSAVILEMADIEAIKDPAIEISKALNHPIGSPPLAVLSKGKKSACIVISDITRPVPNTTLLPPILSTLESQGIEKDRITILIATGMHRPNLGTELESMVGRHIMERYNIVNHYCRDASCYRKVAEIDGAPIEINSAYLDAELKILTGLIEPHFYAGYSGGAKSILPGISSFETMKFMHSFRMIDHPMVTNCVLDGNPFHEYGLRVAEKVGVDFLVNVAISKKRQIAGVFAGHYKEAHRAGCRFVERHSVRELDDYADVVITSGGGYPLDSTFYQISKALICGRNILKKGGTILVACECREGLGSPEFSGILRSCCSPEEFNSRHCDPSGFVIDQWCAQNIYQALDYAGAVYVYSPGLSADDINNIGARKVDDLQSAVDSLVAGRPARLVVVPAGPYVVGMVKRGRLN